MIKATILWRLKVNPPAFLLQQIQTLWWALWKCTRDVPHSQVPSRSRGQVFLLKSQKFHENLLSAPSQLCRQACLKIISVFFLMHLLAGGLRSVGSILFFQYSITVAVHSNKNQMCQRTKKLPEKFWKNAPTKESLANLIWASISINKHQAASIRINQHQSTSISANQHRYAEWPSVNIGNYWQRLTTW